MLLPLLGFFVFLFSLWGLLFEKMWMYYVAAAYVLLIVICLILFLTIFVKSKNKAVTIEEFEKSLKGGLYHFKCPLCRGIFAIKKSTANNKKPIKITCPDCGEIGIIPARPYKIEEAIPEKKSLKANFECSHCFERLTIWAEGTDLYEAVCVYSCPYCGKEHTLTRC